MMRNNTSARLLASIAAAIASCTPFAAPSHHRRGFLQPAGYMPQSWGRRRKSRVPKGTQREKLYYGGYPETPNRAHATLPFKPLEICSRPGARLLAQGIRFANCLR